MGGGDGMGGGSVADSTIRTGSGQVSVFAKGNCSGRVHREARGPSPVGGRKMKGIK